MPDWKLPFPNLNSAQRKAVTHGEGPLLVLAGPGSGKTATITGRIRYLIETKHIPPEQILVLTFSKAAALSMQQRFRSTSSKEFPVNFGTFHSCFYQVLRESRFYVNCQLLKESQKKQLIRNSVKKWIPDAENEEAYQFLGAISYYKNTDLAEASAAMLEESQKEYFLPVFREYEKERKKRGLFDFDDMVYECRRLFGENFALRERWQRRFRHILIDEFQDINPVQYEAIRLMTGSHTSLFAVGDDDQAIYGFRGSKPECLNRFVEDFEAEVVRLRINYRSSAEIIQAAHLVIGENKQRFEKDIQIPICGEEPRGKVLLTSFAGQNEQYAYLKEKLQKQLQNSQETCAVLFRTHAFMQGFAIRLARNGIFFSMQEGGAGIYEHFIVKDVMAYLQAATEGGGRGLFLQIVNKPNRYVEREAFATEDSDLQSAWKCISDGAWKMLLASGFWRNYGNYKSICNI